jgi:hypothetical protein
VVKGYNCGYITATTRKIEKFLEHDIDYGCLLFPDVQRFYLFWRLQKRTGGEYKLGYGIYICYDDIQDAYIYMHIYI